MGQLIYSAITSLDGYVEDQGGNLDWSAPEQEVLSFINDLERPIGAYLYGRRMYQARLYWETVQLSSDQPAEVHDFKAIGQGAEKIVYSRTLESVSSVRTRVEPDFDIAAVRDLKLRSDHDLTVGGSSLAGGAIKAGLVDELRLFMLPVVIGGGKGWLPEGVRVDLELLDTRRFAGGAMYPKYRLASPGEPQLR